MGLLEILHDGRFNTFFSFVIGIGLICILRPMCSGSDCNINKAPAEKDFDKYVYRMGNSSCYEFKTEIMKCPSSGAVEAFKECPYQSAKKGEDDDAFRDQFARRNTIVAHCATIS
jgi:hypothetical protein